MTEKKKEKRKENRKEKKRVFSGHYVIDSSLPPERRPLERRTLVPIYYEPGNLPRPSWAGPPIGYLS